MSFSAKRFDESLSAKPKNGRERMVALQKEYPSLTCTECGAKEPMIYTKERVVLYSPSCTDCIECGLPITKERTENICITCAESQE